ncbi:foldase protein PrsA [Ferruginibacter albus]|uniref:foldase protein PrsA n=1 Tax=Ferruginibacter albus TaxID=2875540 RepID=UPI001CC650EB|nr:peptidylprolyl isomerase [Ferruginibacter albus]UAY51987.1 peptidylprolyl isomerase [Ferruginibacter albus]
MKKLLGLFSFTLITTAAFSQTLFTYGNGTVSKEEFLRAYNKNKTAVENKEQSLREYLDLYSKFKLKVKVAEELHLDTLPQLQADLQNFRNQVEDSYMNDDKGLNKLIDEAFQRKQKDIHVLHFYIPTPDQMSSDDSLRAIGAIKELYNQLSKGNKDYDNLLQNIAHAYLPVTKKDIGYITALSISYPFENIIYGLNPGQASEPFHSKSGWHVFLNLDERQSAGRWKTAQILLTFPPNATPEKISQVEKKADSIYNLLLAGGDFGALAKKYSEDKLTYQNNGEMSEFSTGKYNATFEKNVFALKKDGDFTKPFLTPYGYHIVKRLQQIPTPVDQKADEGYYYTIRQQVLQDSRINAAKQKFLEDVLVRINYKRNNTVKDEDLYRFADSVAANKKLSVYPVSNKMIFSFAKQNYKGSDWLKFANDYRLSPVVNSNEIATDKELFDKYVAAVALEYYRNHLEEYNADFKYQMKEFREGNMLFEIMERNVWSKAANDSVGLVKYYNQYKAKYLWDSSAVVLLFNCANMKAANDASVALTSGKEWRKISDESDGAVQADSSRYELSQIQIPAGTVIKEGIITKPVLNESDNTAGFLKILKVYPANQQRSFEEARGLVINDYQNYLEEQWVNELKKKYPIKVNETVFQSLLK